MTRLFTLPGPQTEAGVRWRFLLLGGLRWLPVGFLAPVLVLLALSRGLSLTETGLVFACYGATTAVLELPTGGLADTFGRRFTLLLSSAAHLAFFALLVGASALGPWLVAAALGGAARALDSGPLEAWYVDQARRLEPGVELRTGLSAAGAVEGAGLALSALAGGLLPTLVSGSGLTVVVWAAIGTQSVHLVAVLALMHDHRHTDHVPPQPGWRAGIAHVPVVVRDGLGLGMRRGPLQMLVASTTVWGVALAGIEILWQPRFVTLLDGNPDRAAAGAGTETVVLGALLAGAFLLAAVGSSCTPVFARMLGGSASRGALCATLLQGTTFAVLAAAVDIVPAAVSFLAFYLVNGLRGPLHNELLHEHVHSAQRSTMLSVDSLTLQAGGFVCALALPAIAEETSIPWAWLGVAVLVLTSALLYRGIPAGLDAEARRASTTADSSIAGAAPN